MSNFAIETDQLTKRFGDVLAVDSVSLRVRQGEIYGFLGLNGAGKTTTIRALLGMIRPSAGNVRVLGKDVGPNGRGPWARVGHLVESPSAYPELTTRENLEIARRLHGIKDSHATTHIIQQLGLASYADRKADTLSSGNLQRLGLAQALMREERVIILDEPTHGLDPVWTQRFRDVVEALRRPGRAIFIASHNLDELQRLADRVAIIDRGRLQRIVEPRAASSAVLPYRISIVGAEQVLREVFPTAEARGPGDFEIPGVELRALNAGIAELLRRGVLVSNLHPAHSVLEQHFRQAVGE